MYEIKTFLEKKGIKYDKILRVSFFSPRPNVTVDSIQIMGPVTSKVTFIYDPYPNSLKPSIFIKLLIMAKVRPNFLYSRSFLI